MKHELFTTEHQGAPKAIKDRNGEVCLAMCFLCGRAEQQLIDVPICDWSRVFGNNQR
jgi:hypothetical protein